MAELRFDITVKTTNNLSKLETALRREAIAKINVGVDREIPVIEERIEEAVRDKLNDSMVFGQLIGGILREHLGIIDAQPAINGIIEAVVKSVHVHKIIYPASIRLQVGVLKSDFSDVLEVTGAEYISYGKSGPKLIKWLEWLLFRGEEAITIGYQVFYGTGRHDTSKSSRTGGPIMIPGNISWGMFYFPEFSGTKENNFLTRALDGITVEISKIIKSEIPNIFLKKR